MLVSKIHYLNNTKMRMNAESFPYQVELTVDCDGVEWWYYIPIEGWNYFHHSDVKKKNNEFRLFLLRMGGM